MQDESKVKLLMAAVLFLTWILLVVNHVTGTEKVIDFIYTSLLAIGGHTAITRRRKPKQGVTPPSHPATAQEVTK